MVGRVEQGRDQGTVSPPPGQFIASRVSLPLPEDWSPPGSGWRQSSEWPSHTAACRERPEPQGKSASKCRRGHAAKTASPTICWKSSNPGRPGSEVAGEIWLMLVDDPVKSLMAIPDRITIYSDVPRSR